MKYITLLFAALLLSGCGSRVEDDWPEQPEPPGVLMTGPDIANWRCEPRGGVDDLKVSERGGVIAAICTNGEAVDTSDTLYRDGDRVVSFYAVNGDTKVVEP